MDQDITHPIRLDLERQLSALERLFRFVRERAESVQARAGLRRRAELVAEELFTNLVKYNVEGREPIEVTIGIGGEDEKGLVLRFVDRGVHAFDPHHAPRVDTTAPLEERRAGGLGLQLVLEMVDSLDYQHEAGDSITTVLLLPRREDAEDRGN